MSVNSACGRGCLDGHPPFAPQAECQEPNAAVQGAQSTGKGPTTHRHVRRSRQRGPSTAGPPSTPARSHHTRGETRRRTTGRAQPQQGGARRSRARGKAHRSEARGRRAQASQPPDRTRPTECARAASGRCTPAPVNARDEGDCRRILCTGKTVQVMPGRDHRNGRRGGWSLARPLWKGDGASNWCR